MKIASVQRIRESYKVQLVTQTASHVFWRSLAPLRRLRLPFELSRRAEVHIHFGCGKIADPRFINVDARALAHVHLVTKSPMLRALPANSADSIYACHVFEHLSFHTQKKVLGRWIEILKPGGRLMLSVPDFDKLTDKFLRNGRDPLSIQASLMGGQDYPGNFHCAIFTDKHLASLLRECGFTGIAPWHPREEQSWPKDHSWTDAVSLNLAARKPT